MTPQSSRLICWSIIKNLSRWRIGIRALWEFTLASRPTGLTERLDEFTLPILVITGDDDRIVPTEDSIRLAGELPNASLEVISQAGHIPHEEKPKEFIQAVTNFLYKLQS